jgi:hypothetical protein
MSTYANIWDSKHENDGKSKYGGGRDVVGYAKSAPNPYWPKKAKVCDPHVTAPILWLYSKMTRVNTKK